MGDAGLAAPIAGRDGVVGSIGLVGPAERILDRGTQAEMTRAVVESARSISRDLGAGRGGAVLAALR